MDDKCKLTLYLDTDGDTPDSRAFATIEVPAYLYKWKILKYKWEDFEGIDWHTFDLISSALYGKQCYFKQKDGLVYSRISGKYLKTVYEAFKEFCNKYGG